jgi:hypothetical protein
MRDHDPVGELGAVLSWLAGAIRVLPATPRGEVNMETTINLDRVRPERVAGYADQLRV